MKVAALGYYGFGNLGDEAVLAGIRTALKSQARFQNDDFLVLSNSPAETPRLHPGTRAANRWKFKEAAQALTGTDLFIFGGGSLLQDATSVNSVIWYALMAKLARAKSKRVLWWGQGVGPLRSKVSRIVVAHIANDADAITVRDEKSEKLLKEIGTRGFIQIVADPAFALSPESSSVLPETAPTVLALRSWRDNTTVSALAADDGFTKALGPLLPLPMHLPEDLSFMSPLLPETKQWLLHNGEDIGRVLDRVAASRMVVAMRLHALIFAARCAVPFVALSYDPKVDALAHAAKQEDALLSVNTTTDIRERFVETVNRVRDTEQERRATLREFATRQTALAIRPAEIAANFFI